MPSSNKTWKVGDLVQLKSGGPVMTVEDEERYDDSYRCQWFAGKKLEAGVFPSKSLVAAKTEPPQAK